MIVNQASTAEKIQFHSKRVGKRLAMLATLRAAIESGDKPLQIRVLSAVTDLLTTEDRSEAGKLAALILSMSREHGGWAKVNTTLGECWQDKIVKK